MIKMIHNHYMTLWSALFILWAKKDIKKKTFEKWIERMQLCIDKQGGRFEHFDEKTIDKFTLLFLFLYPQYLLPIMK